MQNLKNKKVLITCGPTWIPIDDTRIISNKSSGQLGQIIADDLAKIHCKVTLLEGPVLNGIQHKKLKVLKFHYYDDFLKTLKQQLKKRYDIIIHAAAISDYRLRRPFTSKISSKLKKFKLELVPTKKIINDIKHLSPKSLLVGFKLKSTMTKPLAIAKSKVLFEKAKCDLVIANSVSNDHYKGYILNNENKFLASAHSRKEMSRALVKTLNKSLS